MPRSPALVASAALSLSLVGCGATPDSFAGDDVDDDAIGVTAGVAFSQNEYGVIFINV